MPSIATKAVVSAITFCCTLHTATAQEGAMDLTFNATDIGYENEASLLLHKPAKVHRCNIIIALRLKTVL